MLPLSTVLSTRSIPRSQAKFMSLVADLFPPGKHDPRGIHGAIWMRYCADEYIVPSDQPLTLVSYRADGVVEAYVEHMTVGDPLIDMPLFLDTDFYVNIPLEATYQAAYRGVPAFWRDVLEKSST